VAAGQATGALRGYQGIQLTAAAQQQLTSYEFPGNEAELQGLVQRAIMLHPPASAPAAEAAGAAAGAEAAARSWNNAYPVNSWDEVACDQVERPVLVLDVGDFWAATGDADRGRVDVLEVLPWLRRYILDTGGLASLGLNVRLSTDAVSGAHYGLNPNFRP